MGTQRTTLVFDIELDRNGPIAEGLVWYSPPRPLDANSEAKRELLTNQPSPLLTSDTRTQTISTATVAPSASSLATIIYPVASTPVTFRIALNSMLIPRLYVEACLTYALRRMANNVQDNPQGRIPHNTFTFQDPANEVAIAYLGYSSSNWLTWLQLSWILSGLLRFVEQREENCRPMAVEVDIQGTWEAVRFGGLLLWYSGIEKPFLDEN